jgi:IS5 family transposase
VIGHAKIDGRLGRNYLHGREGGKINAILSGCGYNMRKLLTVLLFFYRKKLTLTG